MVRKLVIGFYIFLFWIILPAALVYPSIILDERLDLHLRASSTFMIFGIVIISFSVIMLAISIRQFIHIGSELPISAFHTKRIVRTGLYGTWRHPIYLFFTMFFISVGIIIRSGAMLFIVLPIFVLLESVYVAIEEYKLVSRYGKEYIAYRKETPLVIPHLQNIIRYPCLLIFKLKFSYSIIHRERIPTQPPFFILSAHRNYFDPFLIGIITSLPIYYITTFEVFRSPLSRFLFRKLHCIPRKRYLTDSRATREIVEKINEGSVIMIFPEGERSWAGNMNPFKSQVLKLLKHYSSVPIVPIRIDGNYHAWPRWRKWFRSSQVTLTVQEPLTLSQTISTEEIERQLRSLLEPRDEHIVCSSPSRVQGLTKLIYRCPVCYAIKPLKDVNGVSFFCTMCQTTFKLLPDFHIEYNKGDLKVNQSLNDLYEHIRIHKTDIKPTDIIFKYRQQPSLQEGEWIVALGKDCHYFVQVGLKMKEVAKSDLTLTNLHLILLQSEAQIPIELNSIDSVTIESNNKLQIYQEQGDKLHQFIFDYESALKWQDYIYETISSEQGRHINRT